MKPLLLLSLSLFVFVQMNTAFAVGEVCSAYKLSRSQPEIRQQLLTKTRDDLEKKARQAIASLAGAKTFLKNCNDRACLEVKKYFLSALKEQVRISKLLTVLSKSNILYYEPILKIEGQLQRNELIVDDVMNFSLPGFSFTEEERETAFKLWKKTFYEVVAKYPNEDKIHASGYLQDKINSVFKFASAQLVNMNPLLPFVTEKSLTEKKELLSAFDRLIEFNQEFINIVNGYEVSHKTGFWSYLNLAANDHEMGLVNFTSNIENIISQSAETEKRKYCSAYKDLLKQQSIRVKTSIGVGFSTAVICGVGIWSGVGTLPAAALCSLSVADGLWGAYIGKQHSNMGYYSIYAGKILNMDKVEFSEGVMSYIEAQHLQKSGNAVVLINLVGLVPIAKSVMGTVKGARGSIVSLVTVPSADVASAASEGGSSQLIYTFLALKGLELSSDSIAEIVADL